MYVILFETARYYIVNKWLLCMQETIKWQDKTFHLLILESLVNTTRTYAGQKHVIVHKMQNTS